LGGGIEDLLNRLILEFSYPAPSAERMEPEQAQGRGDETQLTRPIVAYHLVLDTTGYSNRLCEEDQAE
jgi:hypothetical protein